MYSKNSEAPAASTVGASDLPVNLHEKTNMKSIANKELAFHSTVFTPVIHEKQIWLTASELAKALEYKKTDAVSQLYTRNSDEFSEAMTTTLKLRVVRKTGDVDMMVRCFSLRGAHLIAMFSDTPVAKEFRRWALDVMDKEVSMSPIKRRANYNFPVETADPHDRKHGNAWMTPRVILDERNRAPELELLGELEKDGYDITGAKIRIHAMYGITKQFVEMQNELSVARRLLGSLNDVITNQTKERGSNVSFTGSNKGFAYGGLPKRKLN